MAMPRRVRDVALLVILTVFGSEIGADWELSMSACLGPAMSTNLEKLIVMYKPWCPFCVRIDGSRQTLTSVRRRIASGMPTYPSASLPRPSSMPARSRKWCQENRQAYPVTGINRDLQLCGLDVFLEHPASACHVCIKTSVASSFSASSICNVAKASLPAP